MKAQFEKASAGEKLSGFFVAYRKVLIAVLVVLAVFVLTYGIGATVVSNASKKGLEDIDSISYNLTKDSVGLSEEALETRRGKSLSDLAGYINKSGIVGVRANMLSAEVKYSQKNYDDAASFWLAAAEKGKKSYTAPLCYFNAGAAFEDSGKFDDAEKSYEKAVSYKDFDQIAHAKFSLGRVKETKGDKKGAVEVYSELFGSLPEDSWAKLAESRLISIEIADKE